MSSRAPGALEDGDDVLRGAGGVDELSGGAGDDRFDFDRATDSAAAAPVAILDFVRGDDRIDLATIDANGAASGNGVFVFQGASAFAGAAGELRFERVDLAGTISDHVRVEADLDGDRVADFTIRLAGSLDPLLASDFVL